MSEWKVVHTDCHLDPSTGHHLHWSTVWLPYRPHKAEKHCSQHESLAMHRHTHSAQSHRNQILREIIITTHTLHAVRVVPEILIADTAKGCASRKAATRSARAVWLASKGGWLSRRHSYLSLLLDTSSIVLQYTGSMVQL